MVETASPAAIIAGSDLAVNMASFGRRLRAENLSVKTLETYTESTRWFARFLAALKKWRISGGSMSRRS